MSQEFFEFSVYLFKVFGERDKDAYYRLKHEKFTDPETQQFRKLLVALFRLGAERSGGYYEELARAANRLFPRDKKIPTRGGSLARVTSKFLGWPAIYSYNLQGFIISVLITRKYGGQQGKGFGKLLELLGIKDFDQNYHIQRAIDFCRHFEKVNDIVEMSAKHLECPKCSNGDIEVFHYEEGLDGSEFVCSSCGEVFTIDQGTAEELAGELIAEFYKPVRIKDLLNIPEPKFCPQCGNKTVVVHPEDSYLCIWCGITYEETCVECGEPLLSEEGEIICGECFAKKVEKD